MSQPNPSTAQARVIVDELARQGVDLAVISPGSRSGAMAIALAEHPSITVRVVLDERSAGFRALGFSRAGGRPAVCLSTSGTAAANFLPAVVEADASRVPLIVLTADRPPELRGVGANQAIDQHGLFGKRIRWACDLDAPSSGFDGNAYWRSTTAQAVAHAVGHGDSPGPVHLNLAFREPTVPASDDGRVASGTYDHPIDGRRGEGPWQSSRVGGPGGVRLEALEGKRGVLVVGELVVSTDRLISEAARLGWPVLATAQSNLRASRVITTYHHLLVAGVPASLTPEVVVTLGRVGPSERLGRLTTPEIPRVAIDPWGGWFDSTRRSQFMVHADPASTLALLEGGVSDDWGETWMAHDRAMRSALDERLAEQRSPSGPGIARAHSLARSDVLVLGSSLPVRDADAHLVGGGLVLANRGASGIDGFNSTVMGVADAHRRALGYCGDLSFLHDLSAFTTDERGDFVIIVADNNGGGLFDQLPAAKLAPEFERLFVAPHNRDITELAGAIGLESVRTFTLDEMGGEVEQRLAAGGAHVVVVPVDREFDLEVRRDLDRTATALFSSMK